MMFPLMFWVPFSCILCINISVWYHIIKYASAITHVLWKKKRLKPWFFLQERSVRDHLDLSETLLLNNIFNPQKYNISHYAGYTCSTKVTSTGCIRVDMSCITGQYNPVYIWYINSLWQGEIKIRPRVQIRTSSKLYVSTIICIYIYL